MNTSGNKTASGAGQAFGGTGDRIMSRVVFCVAVTGIVILIFILGFLIANGLPVLESTSLGEMFFSKDWYPTEEPPALGMVALIAGTLAATLLSSVMAIPVSIALAIFSEALAAVPGELRDASYALGATRLETIFKVVFPSALPGIIAATLLGVMRALGETMVVLMAAGGAAILPAMFTDPIRPLTSTIAAEMGETPVGSTHYHALFFAGLILLIMTLAINLASLYVEKRGEKR